MSDDSGGHPDLAPLAQRLRVLVRLAGGNQRVAAAAKVPLSTLNTILAGKTDPRLSTLRRLAPALGVPITRLVDDAFDAGNTIFRMEEGDIEIPIREVGTLAPNPSGFASPDLATPPPLGHIRLPAAFWARAGRSPDQVEALQVAGDAMWPTLAAGQWVLVDRADTVLTDGGIFALATPQGLQFRRFQHALDGTAMLAADNRDNYTAERFTPEALAGLTVFGRAFLTVRML
jgi:transcriptional regulator with XRE-family HTH domain